MTLSRNSDPLLHAEHVSVVFADGESDLGALEDISFEVYPGELICFVGPSGCGKSTLLRVLAGLLQPSSGRVTLRGGSCVGPCEDIGIVFQRANLMPWRTAIQNITLPLEIQGESPAAARCRADSASSPSISSGRVMFFRVVRQGIRLDR